MPVLAHGTLRIDLIDEGGDDGGSPPVVLIHSSVSGNRQWRALIDLLKDRRHVLAINLFGYGETTPWPDAAPQTLYAQAQLVMAVCAQFEGPVSLVGHSFGGSVAFKAATLLGARVDKLAFLEANPFWLLAQNGRMAAYLESRALRDHVKCYGALGDWPAVAQRFADYWIGDGAWDAMPDKRRAAFAAALPPNFHEWDAVMDETTTIEQWQALNANTLVVSDPSTRLPTREIVALLARACPHWRFHALSEGGHMAPLTRPDLVNPVVSAFLDAG